MSDANRLRLLRIRENTWGETPVSGDANVLEATSESLKFAIDSIRSERLTSDRNNPGTTQTGARANGGINNELSFDMNTAEFESAMFNTFNAVAEIENSAADTEITQVTDSTDTITVASGGGDFVANHLVRLSGFTGANNSGVHQVSSSTATTVVLAGTPTLDDEAAPPKAAKIKAVGFQGASGDIEAVSDGITSTTLDFTTLGLTAGQWLKIGGSDTADKFATAAVNDWVRTTEIAANKITLDNLPTNWAADDGAGKTIKMWFGDYVRNGSTQISHTYEKSIQSQTSPKYYQFRGMVVNQLDLSIEAGQIATINCDFLGKDQVTSNSTLDSTPLPAVDEDPFNAINNVGRIIEGGSDVIGPNHIQRFTVAVNNNLAERLAIGTKGAVSLRTGDADISGTIRTYFGSDDLIAKYVDGTKTSVFASFKKDNQALVIGLPTVQITDANYNAPGRNQDVPAELTYQAEKSATDAYSLQLDRFEYYEESV